MRNINRQHNLLFLCFALLLAFLITSIEGCKPKAKQNDNPPENQNMPTEDNSTATPEYDNSVWDLSLMIADEIPGSIEKSLVLEIIADDLASAGYILDAFRISDNIDDPYYKAHSISTISRYVIWNEILPAYQMSKAETQSENPDESLAENPDLIQKMRESITIPTEPIQGETADYIREMLSTAQEASSEISNLFDKASVIHAIAGSFQMLGDADKYSELSTQASELFNAVKGSINIGSEESDIATRIHDKIDTTTESIIENCDKHDFLSALEELSDNYDAAAVAVSLSYMGMNFDLGEFKLDSKNSELFLKIAKNFNIEPDQSEKADDNS